MRQTNKQETGGGLHTYNRLPETAQLKAARNIYAIALGKGNNPSSQRYDFSAYCKKKLKVEMPKVGTSLIQITKC